MAVIGLDFGNYNSYTSFIQDLDFATGRLGGRAASLMPAGEYRDGIPSVFFYQEGTSAPLACQAAKQARPLSNQVRYLKRGLFKPLEINGRRVRLQGRDWLYDDAIRVVVQEVLRQANETMYTNYRQTTNLVSLAYPVTYSPPQIEQLIEIVESTTVNLRNNDGTVREEKVRVFGTIPEAPAAALDYLAEHESDRGRNEVTVATFDLGGGTFDAAVVRCYPQGKVRPDGSRYYYDLLWQGGISNLGGKEFTEVVAQIAERKLQSKHIKLNERQRERLHLERAEEAKCKLTVSEMVEIEVKDEAYVNISRAEFEEASQPLVKQMVDVLGQAMQSPEFKPDLVLLSGGASQMPMIEKALKAEFPAWRDKIAAYRPAQAISFGAARYGVTEATKQHSVQKRTVYDLGTDCKDGETGNKYFSCMINKGAPIPHASKWNNYRSLKDDQSEVGMDIFEAVVRSPDENNLAGDYRKIIICSLPFGRKVPRDTLLQGRLSIDSRGVMTVEAREKEGDTPIKAEGRPTLE